MWPPAASKLTLQHKVLGNTRKVSHNRFCFPGAEAQIVMKTKILLATLLTLALVTAGYAQTPDKAKLDQFFDRLAEKTEAMGSAG